MSVGLEYRRRGGTLCVHNYIADMHSDERARKDLSAWPVFTVQRSTAVGRRAARR